LNTNNTKQIEGSWRTDHWIKIHNGIERKYCQKTGMFFKYYQANESESMGGVDRCDQCNEVVRV